ncbi:MAG: rRNA maturation RNase YbeY [Methylococcaceae bacterium]|nr:rRNA maturation RNase YbeY [Methylococcaceae bacterium]
MAHIEIQAVVDSIGQPNPQQIRAWVDAALEGLHQDKEIVVRIVDETESAGLNEHYRHKWGPTNILSFPFEAPEGVPEMALNLLGDLVICAPVVEKEALEQRKSLEHHWAHIIIHGVLHLLGYDHIDDNEAELMESKEITILKQLHINNPYQHEA